MSEAYADFATQIYSSMQQEIAEAAAHSGDLPILVVSGYEHIDGRLEKTLNYFTTDAEEEPAMASAYTHIAAMQASADLVGSQNVLVSFEFDQDKLDSRVDMVLRAINNPSLSLENVLEEAGLEERPVYYAMEYALEQGYEVVASDPWHDSPSTTDPKRFSGEIDALSSQATRYDNRPEIVVHIGGSSHFGTLQGHNIEDLKSEGGELNRMQAINPFEQIYGQTLFFNNFQPGPGDALFRFANRAAEYARNPENAIQVHAPGQMDEADKDLISERISEASSQLNRGAERDVTEPNGSSIDSGMNPK